MDHKVLVLSLAGAVVVAQLVLLAWSLVVGVAADDSLRQLLNGDGCNGSRALTDSGVVVCVEHGDMPRSWLVLD